MVQITVGVALAFLKLTSRFAIYTIKQQQVRYLVRIKDLHKTDQCIGFQKMSSNKKQQLIIVLYEQVVINTEWHSLGMDGCLDFIRSEYDFAVDEKSLHKGHAM